MTQQNRFDIRNDADTIVAMIAKATKISTPQGASVINPTNVYVDGNPPVTTGFNNPMTTIGDIIYASETDTPADGARLAIGTAGQVLTVASGLPAWVTGRIVKYHGTENVPVSGVVVDLGAIADDDFYHDVWVKLKLLDGISHAHNRPRTSELGGIDFSWYKDSGNLKVRITNDSGTSKTVVITYT